MLTLSAKADGHGDGGWGSPQGYSGGRMNVRSQNIGDLPAPDLFVGQIVAVRPLSALAAEQAEDSLVSAVLAGRDNIHATTSGTPQLDARAFRSLHTPHTAGSSRWGIMRSMCPSNRSSLPRLSMPRFSESFRSRVGR